MKPRLTVIVGCPRSGTTWLGQMLLAHPAVTGINEGETSLFLCLGDLFANISRTDGTGLSAYVDVATFEAAVRQFCDRLIEEAVRHDHPDAAVFVERTPAHAFVLRRIARLYPDAAVVHIVRDGRDVARSLAELSFGAPSVRAGAQAWVRTLDAVQATAHALSTFREVRYEDVLLDPVAGVCALFEWLGLLVDDGVRARVTAAAAGRVSAFGTTGPVGTGKWRTLSAVDIADIYLVAGDALVRHGYASEREVRHMRRRPASLAARVRALAGRKPARSDGVAES